MLTIEIKNLGPYDGSPKSESFDPTHILEAFIEEYRSPAFDLVGFNKHGQYSSIVVASNKVPSGHAIFIKTTSLLHRDET